ncbi:hypothetical protein [Kiloniella sp.]|uniref:hypothetical protein n=1 Tax=Kiloniella sp. TaxID=1938587 RepID=UPI003B01261E
MLIVIYLLYVKLSETIHINRLLGGRHLFLLNKAEKSQKSFPTDVFVPTNKRLEGFDIVSFSQENAPECSFLSCNLMAEEIEVNNHCLLGSLDEAKNYLNQGLFDNCEPGPSRIFAVYSLD